jgi:aspartyl-tRNA(Asn)/glutamyl-tRNA(Gln) amidotransferase subunit B
VSAVDQYESVIGLEVHAQLRTGSKMFCACANKFGAPPNTQTCPVCLGLPGALPVPNRRAVELAIRLGLALGAKIADVTRFDRKQYFYPDLPKGYQISQFDGPVTFDGKLTLGISGRNQTVGIIRAHLEEDAGKGMHEEGGKSTLIDLNRCGIPLLEIVSAPDLRSAEAAYDYLTELKLILKTLEISDCDMEKGSLRCDVNVSVRKKGDPKLGTRVEIKNLNSFRGVERAIRYEVERLVGLVESRTPFVAETRLWDDDKGESRLMRTKESAPDYRYFPDPDLPPFAIDVTWIESVRKAMPPLPSEKLRRYRDDLGLSEYDARVLITDPDVARYFEECVALSNDAKASANWITSELFGLMKGGADINAVKVRPTHIAELIKLVQSGTLNFRGAREVLAKQYESPRPASEIILELGLVQVSDRSELKSVMKRALDANPKAVADLKAGKQKAAGAILGFVMRETKGRANPQVLNEILEELLKEQA